MTDTSKDSDSTDNKIVLRRELNLHHLIAIGVGGLIGSGIFVSPVGILIHAGSIGTSLMVWIFCGTCQLLFALCYAELGSRIPLSGSDYIYMDFVYGGLLACIRLWSAMLGFILAQSVFNSLFATYLLGPLFPNCDVPQIAVKLMYFVAVGFVVYVNSYSVRLVARLQLFFTATKIIALGLVIILGVVDISKGNIGQLSDPFLETSTSPSAYPLAFYSGVWALSGWEYLCFIAGEIKHPKRDLRLALVTSLVLTTAIYVFANIAYAVVLSKEEMLASPAVAVAFAQKTMGPVAWVMPLFVACSVLGSSTGSNLAHSRMFYMGAKTGHLPQILSLISVKRRTPIVCLIVMAFMALMGMVWGDNVFYLMELVGFLLILFQALCIVALIKLRRSDQRHHLCTHIIPAPFAVPELSLLILILLLVMTFYRRPVSSILLLIIHIVCFTALYMVCVVWKNKPQQYFKIRDALTLKVQKLLLAIPEEDNQT